MNISREKPDSKPASFWEDQHTQPRESQYQAIAENLNIDVAIIGAGFTGLSTAREIKKDQPSLSVAVLESRYVGYGASGRNGGFNMTLFGLEPEITILRWGKQKTIDAQNYMTKAVNYVHDLVREHKLDSAYEHNGMLRVAYSDAQLKRLENSLELFEKLGIRGNYAFRNERDIQRNIHSPRFRAGVYEKNSGILNPFKHVLALKKLAENIGVEVYEGTPVLHIERENAAIKLHTPNGIVTCKKLVIAVNAWSGKIRGLPRIRSRQTPVWTSQVVTQKLSNQQWADIGWKGREAIEDNRQLIHYFRRTACGRFTMGGGNAAFPAKNSIGKMQTARVWQDLETHIKWLFPALGNISMDYKWGGPVSVNLDMTPEIGFIGDKRIVYAAGCIGHGVSLTQLNGRTIADLILEKKTDLTDFWIVNRKAIPWPPNPIGSLAIRTITGGLKLWDKFEELKLEK